jgi:type IX secretion system PorP/SprF family membrane protein
MLPHFRRVEGLILQVDYIRSSTRLPSHTMVLGLTVVSDKAGPFTQTNIDATYAYHLGLSSKLNLAVGVSAGFSHNVLNLSAVTTADPSDPIFNNLDNNQWKPDLGIGIWAYASDYFIGVSAQQILPQNMYVTNKADIYQNKTVPHYFLTGGVKVFLSDDVTLIPSVMLKYIQPLPTTYDINMKLSFADKIWIGGSYRHNDSYAGLVGLNLSSFVNIGYSYDVTTSSLNTVSNGTHEIVIGILLNNRYKVSSAQHTF